MEYWFDLCVKVLAGVLVIIAFRDKLFPPIVRIFSKPHTDLGKRCDKMEETQKTIIDGQRALLHDSIYHRCKAYLSGEEASVDDLENLSKMYKPYRKMGGNGLCERLFEEVCERNIESVGVDDGDKDKHRDCN